MGRTTVYNKIVDKDKLQMINRENIELQKDFLEYLESVEISPKTIYQYNNDLNIFFVWNLDFNDNKDFVDIKKRDLIKFQKYCLNNLGWSPARVRRVKSCISSMSTYIENILDDEYEDFRSVVNKIESPINEKVREKTVIPDEKVDYLLKILTEQEEYEKACAVAIAVYSGMRKAELLQMKESYFSDDKLVFDGAMYVTEKIRTKGRGKQGKQLQKYILVEAKPYIDNWIKKRKELGVDIDNLFVSKENDKWIARKSIDYWVKSCSEIIGMPFYFHSLRHFIVSKFCRLNLPSEVIREYLGWSDISLISVYNDNKATDNFGKFFTSEGVVKQEENNIFK